MNKKNKHTNTGNASEMNKKLSTNRHVLVSIAQLIRRALISLYVAAVAIFFFVFCTARTRLIADGQCFQHIHGIYISCVYATRSPDHHTHLLCITNDEKQKWEHERPDTRSKLTQFFFFFLFFSLIVNLLIQMRESAVTSSSSSRSDAAFAVAIVAAVFMHITYIYILSLLQIEFRKIWIEHTLQNCHLSLSLQKKKKSRIKTNIHTTLQNYNRFSDLNLNLQLTDSNSRN